MGERSCVLGTFNGYIIYVLALYQFKAHFFFLKINWKSSMILVRSISINAMRSKGLSYYLF